MPSTINSLFSSTNAIYQGVVAWGDKIPTSQSGVYIVSLEKDPDSISDVKENAPIDPEIVKNWLLNMPQFTLDGIRQPSFQEIVDRLKHFWLPDEYIIYIGKATNLKSRVSQYYRTPLGARKPHAGGHWIKTLENLDKMYVHYGVSDQPKEDEGLMLKYFVENISNETIQKLIDPERPFPFANLEYPQGTRKRHGISKSKK